MHLYKGLTNVRFCLAGPGAFLGRKADIQIRVCKPLLGAGVWHLQRGKSTYLNLGFEITKRYLVAFGLMIDFFCWFEPLSLKPTFPKLNNIFDGVFA
jgi:hypothetical protein